VLVPVIEKGANNPEVIAKLRNMRIIPNYKPPAELKKMISEDYENARQIVNQMRLTKQKRFCFQDHPIRP
jgi:tripartite-type tricarboxylate transporter receptor subunit TctC